MRTRAILQALLVTFLWSTSWVLIKIGLKASLPALTFAGLRYSLAFACLAPFVLLNPAHRSAICALPRRAWVQLAALGLVYYTLTQGAQFVSLAFLPAAAASLLLNLTPLPVALASGLVNREPPAVAQWGGLLLCVAGTLVYFFPVDLPAGRELGLAVALVGVLANAASALMGRNANRQTGLPPILITFISMGIGGALLLACGATLQGFGALDGAQWLIIGWLAVVNTAAAFTLWNHTLRTLTAVESSVINGTMLPQIAILAWLFLGESLNPRQIAGMLLVAGGALVVQLWQRRAEGKGKVSSIFHR